MVIIRIPGNYFVIITITECNCCVMFCNLPSVRFTGQIVVSVYSSNGNDNKLPALKGANLCQG